MISNLSGVESSPAATIWYISRTRRGSCDPAEWTVAHRATCCVQPFTRRGRSCLWKAPRGTKWRKWSKSTFCNAGCVTLKWNYNCSLCFRESRMVAGRLRREQSGGSAVRSRSMATIGSIVLYSVTVCPGQTRSATIYSRCKCERYRSGRVRVCLRQQASLPVGPPAPH